MKKTLNILCTLLIFAAALTSCGKAETGTAAQTAETSAPETAAVSETTTAAAETTTASDKSKATEDTVKDTASDAVERAAEMKLGWNLGNTLDATSGEGLDSETSWGQPAVTKELIAYIKESGFSTIRIPVSWSNHVDENNRIDPEWMKRVKEVVDYAHGCGLYIIINSHHDCDRYYPTEERFKESSEFLKDIWTQIADTFADYDDTLIFESMNEPRLKGTGKEWWFQSSDKQGTAAIETIVKLNQVFVDTVRSSGKGNNGTRFLMVPSYAASADFALHDSFVMPEDTVDGRLIASIHAYTPYDFTMNSRGYKEWDGSKKKELNFMKKLDKKFTQNGYGVVIGEFGATNKDNMDDRVAWAKDYSELAASLGISCILWDNGGTQVGEENFGMINRNRLKVYYPELLDALFSGYKQDTENAAAA